MQPVLHDVAHDLGREASAVVSVGLVDVRVMVSYHEITTMLSLMPSLECNVKRRRPRASMKTGARLVLLLPLAHASADDCANAAAPGCNFLDDEFYEERLKRRHLACSSTSPLPPCARFSEALARAACTAARGCSGIVRRRADAEYRMCDAETLACDYARNFDFIRMCNNTINDGEDERWRDDIVKIEPWYRAGYVASIVAASLFGAVFLVNLLPEPGQSGGACFFCWVAFKLPPLAALIAGFIILAVYFSMLINCRRHDPTLLLGTLLAGLGLTYSAVNFWLAPYCGGGKKSSKIAPVDDPDKGWRDRINADVARLENARRDAEKDKAAIASERKGAAKAREDDAADLRTWRRALERRAARPARLLS